MSQNSLLPCYVSFSWKTLKNRWEEQCCTVIAYVFLNLKKKWPNKVKILFFSADAKMLKDDTSVRPREASTEDLLVVHPKKYLDSLRVSSLCHLFEIWIYLTSLYSSFILTRGDKVYWPPANQFGWGLVLHIALLLFALQCLIAACLPISESYFLLALTIISHFRFTFSSLLLLHF